MSLAARFKAALTAMRFPGASAGGGGASSASPLYFGDDFIRNMEGWIGNASTDRDTLPADELDLSSLVMAAVGWVGRTLPEPPIIVVKKNSEGKDNKEFDHPAAQLFRRPNPFHTGSTLLKQFAYSWILDGNVYFRKIRNGGGQVVELWYVPSPSLRPRWPQNGSKFISHYEYRVNGGVEDVPLEDIIHFGDGRDFRPPSYGRCGISPLKSVLRELYSDSETANYSAALLKNGAIPPIIISLKDSTSAVGIKPKDIKEAYQRATQGRERGKVFVSSQAIDVNKMAFNPSEMDLKTIRRGPEERFAAVLGIPAIVLQLGAGLDKATYANAEQLTEFATETYLVPLWRYFEEELSHQLLPEFDPAGKLSMKFDMHKVRALADDETELYGRLSTAWDSGWLKRAEVRAKAGMEFGPEDEIYKTDLAPKVMPMAEEEEDPTKPPPLDEVRPPKQLKAAVLMLSPAGVPMPAEIEATVDWWQAAVPAVAGELLDAEVE